MTWQPPPDPTKIWFPAWDLIPPPIGSRIAGFGYARGQVNTPNDGVEVKVALDPRTTVGEVVEIYLKGRDRLLPFPCFRTNARFDPGMSGGPVFDETGRFCGLICSNLPPSDEGEDHVSWVTLLWPSLAVQVNADREGYTKDVKYPVHELARDQFLHINGWERFGISDDGRPFFRWDKSPT
jgi:hypothetical protein